MEQYPKKRACSVVGEGLPHREVETAKTFSVRRGLDRQPNVLPSTQSWLCVFPGVMAM